VQIEERCLGEAGSNRSNMERKGVERVIMEKVASRKGATQRARAGKPWRGSKPMFQCGKWCWQCGIAESLGSS